LLYSSIISIIHISNIKIFCYDAYAVLNKKVLQPYFSLFLFIVSEII
jgi:hypothetical protein